MEIFLSPKYSSSTHPIQSPFPYNYPDSSTPVLLPRLAYLSNFIAAERNSTLIAGWLQEVR